jgi:Domain of unknown function (DUF3471)
MYKPAVLFLMSILSAWGQWPDRVTAKPDLTAPAPRAADGKPDLSGFWQLGFNSYFFDVTGDLKPGDIAPWAKAVFDRRTENLAKDRWTIQCLPGGPAVGLDRQVAKIVQTPELIVILYEDLTYRQIFLDGRGLPADPNPTWMGYSVGKWEGDTLVVESAGFNDRTWLDYGGHPHTEALHITERYQRVDAGHIHFEMTYSDPKAYARPWTIRAEFTLLPGSELIEYVCAENEKDRPHLVGTAADDLKSAVTVPAATLAKYAGAYEFTPPGAPAPMIVGVSLEGTELSADFAGQKMPLTPQSETTFSTPPGAAFRFVTDKEGNVSRLVITAVEGDITATRKK